MVAPIYMIVGFILRPVSTLGEPYFEMAEKGLTIVGKWWVRVSRQIDGREY